MTVIYNKITQIPNHIARLITQVLKDLIINFINPFLRFRSTRLAEAKVADIQDTIHQGQIAPILKKCKISPNIRYYYCWKSYKHSN